MKGKRRLSGVLLIITALIIMQLPVSEADAATSASDFRMEGTTLVKYKGTEKNVSVPDTVEVIAEEAFEENNSVERIELPNSVKSIEPFAFWGCDNLETVVFGSGLSEVGDYAFANCKGLEKVTIPGNIRNIGIQAFADCVNLTDITIPPQVTSIHETAFDGCYRLYIHCEPGSYADKYAEMFYEKQKEMPEYEDVPDYDNDTSDDDSSPNDTDNDSTTMPEVDMRDDGELLGSTKVVGNHAVLFIDNTSPTVLEGSEGEKQEDTITNEVLDADQNVLSKFTIVDGKIVADQAYYKNTTLKQVKLPEGLEEIGQFAFARSSVTKIVIPEGVKEIGYGAFYHADQLKKIELPTTIENVEPKAFAHTLWLNDFMERGKDDFLISGNVLVAYRGNGADIVIPDGVTLIAAEAFMNHAEIQSVTLPDSLLTVGEGAFEGCAGLKTIHFASQLTNIKDRAFAGCPLEETVLPASVSEMGLKVFDEEVAGNILYAGKLPKATHEVSAERLSNEKYRNVTEENVEAGVTVTGIEPYFATLEGAKRGYTLAINKAEDISSMETAYNRAFQSTLPENMAIYDLLLTDNSGIPLTKLGTQVLTVMLPVPEELAGENVVVYTLDRNGQLEKLQSARVILDGVDAISFKTTHLSLFGICGGGSKYNAEDVLEITTTMESMSAGPKEQNSGLAGSNLLVCLKWLFGIGFLFAGTICILYKQHK